jgi:hypothetical protein
MESQNLKVLNVSGGKIVIKKADILDFVDSKGLPFSFFALQDAQENGGIFGQIRAASPQSVTEKEQKTKDTMRAVFEKLVLKTDIPPDEIISNESLALFVYSNIIMFACDNVRRPYLLDRNFAVYVDRAAQRYGKLPSEYLGLNINQIEAYMFNTCVLNAGLEADIKAQKEQEKLLAKYRAKRRR